MEYISNPKLIGAKTLFATHYHELTELEGKLESVHNYCIAVSEQGDDIIFLRKIIKGGADKSYGIQVAKLAGVPEPVIERAKDLVEELSNADISYRAKEIETADFKKSGRHAGSIHEASEDMHQYSLFDLAGDSKPKTALSSDSQDSPSQRAVIEKLKSLDISNMTPLEALNELFTLQKSLKQQ